MMNTMKKMTIYSIKIKNDAKCDRQEKSDPPAGKKLIHQRQEKSDPL